MNRKELDAFAARYALTPAAVEAALEVTKAKPSAAELERFAVRVLQLAGVLSLAAGAVFFVAANWAALAVLGRFALLEAAFMLTVGAALWRPPPSTIGRYAALLAFLLTGALLALVGQTYQTGADVYELFFTWALLGVGFVIAAQWSVAFAAWLLVLNVALLLFCGWRPQGGFLWLVLGGLGLELSQLLMAPTLVNLALWLVGLALAATRWSRLAPLWLGRFALSCGVGFGTWAGIVAILGLGGTAPRVDAATILVLLMLWSGVAALTLWRRRDVFPLAAIAGSLILLSSIAIGRYVELEELGMLFTLAAWLIVSSTVAGHFLMKAVRAWRTA